MPEVSLSALKVSDHETGGVSIARQIDPVTTDYFWFAEPIINATRSCQYLAKQVQNFKGTRLQLEEFIRRDIFKEGLGSESYPEEAVQKVADAATGFSASSVQSELADLVSRAARVGWTTKGHTGVDVNLYAYGKESENLRGHKNNVDIGLFIADILGLDLSEATSQLERYLFSLPRKVLFFVFCRLPKPSNVAAISANYFPSYAVQHFHG